METLEERMAAIRKENSRIAAANRALATIGELPLREVLGGPAVDPIEPGPTVEVDEV